MENIYLGPDSVGGDSMSLPFYKTVFQGVVWTVAPRPMGCWVPSEQNSGSEASREPCCCKVGERAALSSQAAGAWHDCWLAVLHSGVSLCDPRLEPARPLCPWSQDAQVRVLLVLDCAFSGCPLSHARRGRGAVRSLLLGHKSHHGGTTLMT